MQRLSQPLKETAGRIFRGSALLVCLLAASCGTTGTSPSGPFPLSSRFLPSLPAAVSGNAVAASGSGSGVRLYSFMGLGEGRTHRDITASAYEFLPSAGSWRVLPDVPGGGRLGAVAQGHGDNVYIFGGFTVDSRLRETTLGRLDIYHSPTRSYSRGSPMPLPVDDTVAGLWNDRLMYLIGGWTGDGNTTAVQIYDPAADSWTRALPYPGEPVFGHGGGIVGNAIVFCDGVTVSRGSDEPFRLTAACWRGDIDPSRPADIRWRRIPAHPGRPRYRMACGVLSSPAALICAGGADLPFSYSGIGYDGTPATPSADTFVYDPARNSWQRGPDLPAPSMDHRGLAGTGRPFYLAGGMGRGLRVLSTLLEIRTGGNALRIGRGKRPPP